MATFPLLIVLCLTMFFDISPSFNSNRAAAKTKIADFQGGLEDCNKAIALDPAYVRAWSRKGGIEFYMKEYHKALQSYKKGLELDPNNEECKSGLESTRIQIQMSMGTVDQERAAKGLADPEIQAILRDPMVIQVLQDAQTDRSSLIHVI